jgi:hypothetical protein
MALTALSLYWDAAKGTLFDTPEVESDHLQPVVKR